VLPKPQLLDAGEFRERKKKLGGFPSTTLQCYRAS